MKICNRCQCEVEEYYEGKLCKVCVNTRKREWDRKRKNRKCAYCNKEFIPYSAAPECSVRCRLLNKIEKKNECWEWKGKITHMGYGELTVEKKYRLAHRLSYETFIGKIPAKLCVMHSCDNKKCINPDHLSVGTQKDNIHDAKEKGRLPDQRGKKHSLETLEKLKLRPHADRRGEKHHLRKLNNEDVVEIRKLIETEMTQKEIGAKFLVNPSVVSCIKNKKAWAHI